MSSLRIIETSTPDQRVRKNRSIYLERVLLIGLFLMLVVMIANQQHPQSGIIQQQTISDPAVPVRQSERRSFLMLLLGVLSVFTIGIGLYLSILLQNQPYPSLETLPALEVYVDFPLQVNTPIVPLEDYEIVLFLRPLDGTQDIEVFLRADDTKRRPLGSSWSIPKFTIMWPGHIELMDELDNNFYDIQHLGGRTIISTKYYEHPNLRFKWFQGVRDSGLFQHRISLRMGHRVYPGIDWREWEKLYSVAVIPMLPSESRIVFQRPTTVENIIRGDQQTSYIIGVTSDFESADPGNDRVIRVADSDFDIVYEKIDADRQRNFIYIMIGLLFGLGGNFLASLFTEWAASANRA